MTGAQRDSDRRTRTAGNEPPAGQTGSACCVRVSVCVRPFPPVVQMCVLLVAEWLFC